MVQEIATELTRLVDAAAEKLKLLDDSASAIKAAPDKWSRKEILGHLIDSACNNHQRFVRGQESDVLIFPRYDQDHWVRVQTYHASSWTDLVELWRLYNRHLAHVIRHVPEDRLAVECRIGPYETVTLASLIQDYVVHLKHHLSQIEGTRGLPLATTVHRDRAD